MKNSLICNYLDELFPEPKCELNFSTDYELLIAVVLSAQSTDKRVNECTKILYKKYDTIEKLAQAELKDLESIIRPVGSFHKKSEYIKKISTIIVEKYNGVVPTDREILESFPGVGRKTTNVFLSEYYNIPAIAVDTHVERISKRLKLSKKSDNVVEVEKKLMKFYKKEEWSKRHLQMVLFGRYKCKAIKPLCEDCKLKKICTEKKKDR